MGTSAIVVENLSKSFRLYQEKNQSLKTVFLRRGRARYEEFWAVNDVSFEIPEGSTFGLIGSNGSGKSTLLKCLARILQPDRGQITTNGRISALLELGTGFHPELTGRDNIYLNGSILGLRRKDIDRRLDAIIDFADIGRHIDTPVKHYSSGMYVRLGFAVAINVDPDILLVDEVLAVGDEAFQRKCVQRFEELRSGGRTVVIVSHSLAAVAAMCDTVALLNHGHLEKLGTSREVIEDYLGALFTEQETDVLRWGTREVRITNIEALDGTGQATHFVRLGETLTLRFHYEADIVVEEPLFHFAISHVDGTLVTNPNTRELGQVPHKVEGEGFVDYVIPKLLLIPGQYDLSAGILDRTAEHVYDRRNKFLRLDVGLGDPAEISGLVSLGGRFGGTPYGEAHVSGSAPFVRVVILNWNGGRHVGAAVEAVLRTRWPANRLSVVVVDNASTDGSDVEVERRFPVVDVRRTGTNLGFPGNNAALTDLDGVDYVALVNNDAFVEPDWLAPLVEAARSDPALGAVSPKLVFAPRSVS